MASSPALTPQDESDFFDSVPKGIILPWFVKTGNVPRGWAICDGSGITPDLRQHFLIGVASTADVGSSVGSSTHNHHYAVQTSNAFGAPDAFKIDDDRGCCPQVTGLGHSHSVSGTTGDGSSLPPSVGVLFIMKVE